MKQRLLILSPIVLMIVAYLVYHFFLSTDIESSDIIEVQKGKFELYVVSMGELEAHKSKDILIPDALIDRTIRIREITISNLVREGTEVKKGDYVATLDPSEVEENVKSTQETLDMLYVNLKSAKMDSSLNLSDARDAIRQSKENLLDDEIKVEQSKYESKAVQRQAKIELEMAQRSLEKEKRNYTQQRRKNELSIRRIEDQISQEEKHMDVLLQLRKDLVIYAPSKGVVVYARDWNGDKVKAGSTVGRWDPRIAILPDLSTILSVTYVKEIDVTKIFKGMPVKISIDAFPGKFFDGTVMSVANIGKEIDGQFLNGFKVAVEVDPAGLDLLPGMTSTNRFIIHSMEDQLMVPRKAVFVEGNNQFVFKKTPLGIVHQEVEAAGENEESIRIIKGLREGDKIFLNPPE
jgi:multidrug efflux pump subunit AcrA (membrane-fusion protein)